MKELTTTITVLNQISEDDLTTQNMADHIKGVREYIAKVAGDDAVIDVKAKY